MAKSRGRAFLLVPAVTRIYYQTNFRIEFPHIIVGDVYGIWIRSMVRVVHPLGGAQLPLVSSVRSEGNTYIYTYHKRTDNQGKPISAKYYLEFTYTRNL